MTTGVVNSPGYGTGRFVIAYFLVCGAIDARAERKVLTPLAGAGLHLAGFPTAYAVGYI
jgi:hypothetical protein